AHNTRIGMFDYRMYDPVPCARPLQVFKLFQQIIDGIVVNKERALAEVRADYSTTTEIADALLQRAEVPFRVGHHFASQLTDYGRGKSVKLHEIPYAEAERIYAADTQQKLPLSETDFREIISAEYMVFGRKGIGGPQLAEVNRMLTAEKD
ncbi:MAG: argininosuccinate lyase, partial [Proteobacteria bacterium]|nr:argininosuccinate lyase [Pseudomonadota bacterium]